MILLTCFIGLLFVNTSLQASIPSSPSYEAGVVEYYYGTQHANPNDSLAFNLRQYLEIMENAPSNLDVIVFPELTLNQFETAFEIPEPQENVTPCDNETYSLENLVKQISCASKNFQLYVLVNMVTKAKCPDVDMIEQNDPRNCSDRPDGFSYYNTNVVFDRNGTLISRYRKSNLFGERVDTPYKPSIAYFDTDFGVRIGHFISFDLQFSNPALELVRTHNITDIAFTAMWYSELPFLTAVQLLQHWAYATNVNLLAAGASNPPVASTGSGIFAGRRGSLISVMEGGVNTTLYTATVPKRGLGDHLQITERAVRYTRQEMASLALWRDQLEPYTIYFLDDLQLAANTSVIARICHGELCCTFDFNVYIKITDKPYYRYALAVYHGKRTFSGVVDAGVVTCVVIPCQSNNVTTCGTTNETLEFVHHWNKLEISGKFPHGDHFNYMPNTLDSSIMPLGTNETVFEQKTIESANGTLNYDISISLINTSRRDFYAFGIYGRDFSLDGNDQDYSEDAPDGDKN